MKSIYSDQYNAFLKLIITSRKEAGFTQQDLADKLNKTQSYVSKYERGERRLDLIELLDILKVLNIDPSKFLRKLNSVLTSSKFRGGSK